MLPFKIKENLLKNWGEKADALECYVEICFYHTDSRWHCYLYALNPDDDDLVKCIITDGDYCEIAEWSLERLLTFYDRAGEFPLIDPEFRRIRANILWKTLRRDHATYRDKRITG